MKRFIKWGLVIVIVAIILCSSWIFPTFFPDDYKALERNTGKPNASYEVTERRRAQEKLEKEEAERLAKEAELAAEKAELAAEKAKLESPSYKKGTKDGWENGYIIGKADARDGRARRGLWAKKQAEIFMSDQTDEIYKEAFIKNMHEGYNEAWHAKRDYMKAQGLID